MSLEASGWAWQQPIPSHLKFTLVALSEWADPTGLCWPAVGTIAERVGLGESTVRRHLVELVELGLVVKLKRRRDKRGHLRSWEYQLELDVISCGKPSEEAQSLPLTSERKDQSLALTSAHPYRSPVSGHKEEPPREPPEPLSADADEGGPGYPQSGMSTGQAFDALADACGLDAEGVRAVGGGLIGTAAKTIRKLGVTRQDVLDRAAEYRRQHPEWDLTPTALVKWWPTLEPANGRPSAPRCQCGQLLNGSHNPLAHDAILS